MRRKSVFLKPDSLQSPALSVCQERFLMQEGGSSDINALGPLNDEFLGESQHPQSPPTAHNPRSNQITCTAAKSTICAAFVHHLRSADVACDSCTAQLLLDIRHPPRQHASPSSLTQHARPSTLDLCCQDVSRGSLLPRPMWHVGQSVT